VNSELQGLIDSPHMSADPTIEAGRHLCQTTLRAANEHDACVQRPDHHEVVSTEHTQPGAHAAFAPHDLANNLRGLTNHLRLDVRTLVGKIDQDHVAELKHLDIDLNRHRLRV
jgi:hypothetical protein